MGNSEVVCWEALDSEDEVVEQARHLYETTLEASERIPWAWIQESVGSRRTWRPGHWSPHLLLAARRVRRRALGRVLGFAYGVHVPDYGGYACYLGVDPTQRGRGAGTRLMRLLLCVLKVDAACEGVPLSFVVWESRRPEPDAPPEAWDLWKVRLRLFERLGAWWISDLPFLAPNFARRQGPPVPLQLFLIPMDKPPEAFTAASLRQVAAGLLREVYGRTPGDSLVDQVLAPGHHPALRPLADVSSPE